MNQVKPITTARFKAVEPFKGNANSISETPDSTPEDTITLEPQIVVTLKGGEATELHPAFQEKTMRSVVAHYEFNDMLIRRVLNTETGDFHFSFEVPPVEGRNEGPYHGIDSIEIVIHRS